jgi:hypothetical protein
VLCLCLGTATALASRAARAERRIAVVVGNDIGATNDPPLRFAERDASRVARVLVELGGVNRRDLFLLLGSSVVDLRASLEKAESLASRSGASILFYYSGHADEDTLHLGAGRLAWSEVEAFLGTSRAPLRIALLDACQAGSLTTAKGFTLGPPLRAEMQRGTAILAAGAAAEAAQEALSLRGSIFTHFLLSALRGAADADRDGRVTLAEAHAYTATRTTAATGAWARTVQHPSFRFEISGHGDVVLSELREAAARLRLGKDVTGHVVITEKGTSDIVVEAQKTERGSLDLALPIGRYVVHVRNDHLVHVAEANLPWGGQVDLTSREFVPRSYQSLALKGPEIEIHRHAVSASAAVLSLPLAGLAAVPAVRLQYGYKLGAVDLGTRFTAWRRRVQTVDTTVLTDALGAGIVLSYEWPLSRMDVRTWGFAETQLWRQDVVRRGTQTSMVTLIGAGLGLRIPLTASWFAQISGEGGPCIAPRGSVGAGLRWTGAAELGAGSVF